ncbi:hypothetical protein Q5P01_011520 [Channa striata]|uniref:CAP-Gly domain-containing protein n=1 Tax=Channa striata TaxID=64152 RepID=A0AA88MTW3_CHASR|nr:hypothetical protein Q5P01_011520 [Channa striata]
MTTYILWSMVTWTFKGILCTCRFLWICPYNAIQFLPREPNVIGGQADSRNSFKGVAAIPGSPDRTAALHKRLTKTEKDILSLKTRIACERASWDRRFAELQRKQEELCNQVWPLKGGVLTNVGRCSDHGETGVDNGEVFEECSSGFSRLMQPLRASDVSVRALSGCQLSSSSALSSRLDSSSSSATSFCPPLPMDLQLGHRVRILLPSGRISTGTVRFLGHLKGEADLHLGVELQTPDHGLRDGSHRGHSYFECKPGYGAFVPFHKLLMAWE